ncbi:MAG: hypothetical protein PHN56_00375 [Candidatus Nanoarchaeia archaeon]|nr:hypothetical protein [Candidatus Nanoarchaeia archaeon]
MVKFCECGGMLREKKDKESNELELICKCGKTYEFKKTEKNPINQKKINQKLNYNKTIIIDQDTHLETLLVIPCPNCGYDKGYTYELPPLYGDEDNLNRYKCGKCKTTYSDDAKIG